MFAWFDIKLAWMQGTELEPALLLLALSYFIFNTFNFNLMFILGV